MATSTNYGWAEPDNSSLVKNGASDMRTLGNAIDVSLWNSGFGQAGKNKIINGDFGIWQRGTSFTTVASGTYWADRWVTGYHDINPTTASLTRQTFTAGTAPVANYEGTYFGRSTITTVGSTTVYTPFAQKIEDVRQFAGQTVTLSFWAKSDSSRNQSAFLYQDFGSGGSTGVSSTTYTFTTTTSWQRFSYTFSVASITGKTIGSGSNLSVFIRQAAASGSVLDIWGVQVEYGSTATPFQTATGTIQGELAACQRYYERNIANSTASSQDMGTLAYANGTTSAFFHYFYKVTKRVTPSFSFSGTFQLTDAIAFNYAITNMTLNTSTSNETLARINASVASGLTAKFIYFPQSNATATSYIEFSAEL